MTVASVLARVLPFCDRYTPAEHARAWIRAHELAAAMAAGSGQAFIDRAWARHPVKS